jgi:baculoviral IAP repeat-containing protein 6
VLVSIQSLIMVSDPFFNEPGYESQIGTPSGNASSDSYNRGVRHGTMQFGIVDMLRNPCPVFADVIANHFRLKKDEVRACMRVCVVQGGRPGPDYPSRRHRAFQTYQWRVDVMR